MSLRWYTTVFWDTSLLGARINKKIAYAWCRATAHNYWANHLKLLMRYISHLRQANDRMTRLQLSNFAPSVTLKMNPSIDCAYSIRVFLDWDLRVKLRLNGLSEIWSRLSKKTNYSPWYPVPRVGQLISFDVQLGRCIFDVKSSRSAGALPFRCKLSRYGCQVEIQRRRWNTQGNYGIK